MTAPRRRPATAPTVRDVCDALTRAADRDLSWTIADLPDGVTVADLDGIVYLAPDQPVSDAATDLIDAIDQLCDEVDRPRRHLHAVPPAAVVAMTEQQRAAG